MSNTPTVPAKFPSELIERSKPLRDDVRMLGRLLGENIRRFDGERIYEAVEDFRRLFKRLHRQGDESALEDVHVLLSTLDHAAAAKVTKAFLTYFDLINMAEQNH